MNLDVGTNSSRRLEYLDGLRGIASFVVLIMHVLCFYIPAAIFGSSEPQHRVLDAFSESPFFGLVNGSFAVAVFFVLSGFVIAMMASRTKENLIQLTGRRYLRLTLPIIASVLFCYFWMTVFPNVTSRLLESTGNVFFEDFYPRQNYPIYRALWDGIYNCYYFGESIINNVLWSMQIELFGSLMIYLCYKLLRPSIVVIFYIVCSVLILVWCDGKWLYLIGFCFGALIFEQYTKGRVKQSKWSLVLVLMGILLGSVPIQAPQDTVLLPLIKMVEYFKEPFPVISSFAASFLLVGILSNKPTQYLLAHKVSQWLGKVSFGLYLTHLPILSLVGGAIYLKFLPEGIEVIFFISFLLMISLLTASIFTKIVELPVIAFLGKNKLMKIDKYSACLSTIIFIYIVYDYGLRVGYSLLMIAILGFMSLALFVILNSFFHNFISNQQQ